MRFLIVGLGSMGKRRIRNLRALGETEIAGFDPRPERRDEATGKYGIATYPSFEAAMRDFRAEALIISTPPDRHMDYAFRALEHELPCFIEASVTDLERILELERQNRQRALPICPSCTMLYFPMPETVGRLIADGAIGRPLIFNYMTGQYLPDWHPWEDYRDFYMAKKEQGGGALLDESHGIDLLRWLFGEVSDVSAFVCNVSDLEISSDDLSVLQLRFAAGPVVQAHFDLLGRTPRIGLEVVGADGTLLWDRIDPKIAVYDAASGEWSIETFDKDDDIFKAVQAVKRHGPRDPGRRRGT